MKQLHQGFTLFETMFGLAVISVFLLLSFQFYNSFRKDSEIEQVRLNVDELFQALSAFYQAKCASRFDFSTTVNVNYLKSINFLDKSFPRRNVPEVTNNYIVQYNQIPPMSRYYPKDLNGGTYNIGSIIVWTAQVAVQVADATKADLYKNYLAADCISSLSGGKVTPCSNSKGTGDFLVWEKLPSFASPGSKSLYWSFMPSIKQFNLMYTTAPINVLTSNSVVTNKFFPQQYFLCGG